jgi:tetratricopeptide (TPR) repeat protein/tRNA A-37 threonylcarbamoyl transferase component Bud32
MNERDIFHAAVEFTDPAQRSAYLEEVCAGDPLLKQHVEDMLQAYPQLGTFLESPAIDLQGAASPPLSAGRFQLGQELARGGMGVIYRARDDALGRDVAVKVLHERYRDDCLMGQRFLDEARITAQLQHPGIPPVFEVGRLDDGRPYLAMKLIKGRTLEDLLSERPGPASDRGRFLAMFEQICQAVGYAHSHGVLHRDLKPANVMVGAFGEVQVMDWGVAKLLAPVVAAHELAAGTETTCGTVIQTSRQSDSGTLAGCVVGTPAFMAPEQAGGASGRLDERTDVFGLGAILCVILTGKPPYTGKSGEEVRAKATLGTLADTHARLEQCGADARLVELCRACLSADQECRPRDGGAVAAAVHDYLAGVEERARQAETERAEALVREAEQRKRRRTVQVAGGVIAVVLLVGTVIATWQAIVATQAQDNALKAALAENRAKLAAADKEAETQAVLDFVLNRILAAARPEGRPGGLGPDVKLSSALEAALPVVEESFKEQPLVEARLRMTLGDSFRFLGDNKTAAAQYSRARALYTAHLGPDHVDTLQSMNNLANALSDLNRYEEALELRQETLDRRRATLGPDHVETLMSMRNLASSLADIHHYDEACKLEKETLTLVRAKLGPSDPATLACMNNLALTYTRMDHLEDAVNLQEEVLKLSQATLGADHPDTLLAMNNLAVTYYDLKRYPRSIQLQEEALKKQKAKLPPDHPDTATSMYNLANSYGIVGNFAKALKWHSAALEIRKTKLGLDHKSTLWSMWGVSAQLMKLDRGAEAVPLIDECLQRAAKLKVQPNLLGLTNLRIKYFAKLKDPVGCRTTAELWEKLKRTDRASLYNAACYRAVTARVLRATDMSPETLKQADAEADQAMAWLRHAVTAGYANLKNLRQDTDLDALRDRADFQRLVTELEAGKPQK